MWSNLLWAMWPQATLHSSMVGIGSVGKSNLLRFLQRDDVLREYLGAGWDDYLFVYVDINKLLRQSRWGLFELMLHQLFIELSNRGTEDVVIKAIDDLHGRAVTTETRFFALRYLDRAIGIVCNQLKLKLVFLTMNLMSYAVPSRPGAFPRCGRCATSTSIG